jgi:anti-sigma regulatory factor (Ser/Thr protein kinase)
MADPQPLLELRFPAAAGKLKEMRAQLRETAASGGAGPECVEEIVLAVDEVCQNIIRHAYAGDASGEIVLSVERQDDSLILWVRDRAPRIDPNQVEGRDLDDVRPGGIGVHLIKELMDECGFVPQPSQDGNLFRMLKKLR